MRNLTRFALRRPVTMILALITVLYFGLQAVFGSPMELTPEIEYPMMIISTVYAGASPEDINETVSKKIEAGTSTLSGIKNVYSYSMENSSLVLLRYNYGTNMDTAYLDLKKAMDTIKPNLPDDAKDPTLLEMDMNAQAVMQIMVSGGTDGNLRSYVNDSIVPELEKLSSVAEVTLAGGRDSYIRIELDQTKMKQYHLDMNTVAQLVGAADFTMPSGSTDYGDQKLNVSVGATYQGAEAIRSIVLPLANGDVIHLGDVANVYDKLKDPSSLSRYDGEDVVTVSIRKQQSASAVKVSEEVHKELTRLQNGNARLDARVIYDSRDMIVDSLNGVYQTLIIAILLAMAILFLFFGDIKASLIVGSSIPISVMISLVCMRAMGFSMNLISVGSLVLGVGMVVDNSIVVLDSCFREKEDRVNHKMRNFYDAAIAGSDYVLGSITGSTVTTCVVFLPLALLKGLSGQLFRQLGFTIVFCMLASLVSACTIVPMLYYFLHPREKNTAPVNHGMQRLQAWYKKTIAKILPHTAAVLISVVAMLVLSILMAGRLGTELMPKVDEGLVAVTVDLKPDIKIDEADKVMRKAEAVVAASPEVKNYLVTYGNSGVSMMSAGNTGGSITAYLKDKGKGTDKRQKSTEQVITEWKDAMNAIPNATITMESGSTSGMGSFSSSNVEVDLESADLDTVKKTADQIVEKLHEVPYVTKPHSSAENAAPLLKVKVDPVKAQAEGLTPAGIGSTLYLAMSGKEVMTYTVGTADWSVRVEYPDGTFDSLDKIKNYLLTTSSGRQIPVSDIAEVSFEDSPSTIVKMDKKYRVSITAQPVEQYKKTAKASMNKLVDDFQKPAGVEKITNNMDETMNSEIGGLMQALLTAVFLVFVVMAMQFESPKFSFMVMFTIPFSLIGAFGFLFLADCKISMVSMIGFLMMVGTVVNNGILYVDTVNHLRLEMPKLDDALAEAGAIRLRPIFMTTLTTIIAMIPMCLKYGRSGEYLQGLALVNVGGLTASTVLALLLLPTLYKAMDKWGKKRIGEDTESVD